MCVCVCVCVCVCHTCLSNKHRRCEKVLAHALTLAVSCDDLSLQSQVHLCVCVRSCVVLSCYCVCEYIHIKMPPPAVAGAPSPVQLLQRSVRKGVSSRACGEAGARAGADRHASWCSSSSSSRRTRRNRSSAACRACAGCCNSAVARSFSAFGSCCNSPAAGGAGREGGGGSRYEGRGEGRCERDRDGGKCDGQRQRKG